ncbi:MAG TPA: DUF2147 domain-containing protein [Caldimonas sp.]|jgi:uncharacterized protein (DUF2147 family)|nr:DUF2147 domain-containing protein [Caldimonas sp.]HEX2539566.1 DUF2147 domain-containing protein [Caldimonas sp.]
MNVTLTASHRFLAAFALMAAAFSAFGQAATPAGTWRTIDDKTKQDKSLVRIVESGGVYTGRVEKIVDPDAPKDAVCKDCTDDRKDKPIVGMTILRGVKQSPKDGAVYEGGDILDPNNGKVYRVRLKVVDNGARLEVRGFIGTPMLGRTQTWVRAE